MSSTEQSFPSSLVSATSRDPTLSSSPCTPYVQLIFCWFCVQFYLPHGAAASFQSWRHVWATLGAGIVAHPPGKAMVWCLWFHITLFPCVRAERFTGDEQDREKCRKEAVSGLNDLLWFDSFVIPIFVIFNQKPTVQLPWKPWFLETQDYTLSLSGFFSVHMRVVCLLVETESLVLREKLPKCHPIRF